MESSRSSESMSNLPKLRRNASTSSDMSSLASQGPSTNTGLKMFFCNTYGYMGLKFLLFLFTIDELAEKLC